MPELRPIAIVQARMGSTRLPGKVLADLGGRTMLERQMERMLAARTLAGVVVATSVADADDAIARLVEARGWSLYRGSELDVLARYAGAAETFAADPVVRMTMDCPLMVPAVVDRVVSRYLDGSVDFVSNNLEPSYPHGLDLEVFSRAALDAAHHEAVALYDREHVSPFITARPERFRLGNVRSPLDLHHYRWTVDTADDLEHVRAIYAALGEGADFSTKSVLAALSAIGRR